MKCTTVCVGLDARFQGFPQVLSPLRMSAMPRLCRSKQTVPIQYCALNGKTNHRCTGFIRVLLVSKVSLTEMRGTNSKVWGSHKQQTYCIVEHINGRHAKSNSVNVIMLTRNHPHLSGKTQILPISSLIFILFKCNPMSFYLFYFHLPSWCKLAVVENFCWHRLTYNYVCVL